MHRPALALVLAACSGGGTPDVDSDLDGLLDSEEAALGSDPNVADTDGDGLIDGAEVAAGTDVLVADTDGDGYGDRDELHEGKDPLDPESVIYRGGWPYYFAKDQLTGGNTVGSAAPGKRIGRFRFVDQFGDTVDLFDFYNADKPVVIDISALWCQPCHEMARYIEGEPSSLRTIWPAGPDAVARGDIYWITVLGEGYEGGEPAVEGDAAEWASLFPSEHVPVLADPNYLLVDYVGLGAWPTVLLLEPDLKVSKRAAEACAQFAGTYGHPLCELDLQFPE